MIAIKTVTVEQENIKKGSLKNNISRGKPISEIENAFKRLAHFTEQFHIHIIVNIIASVCVLHNYCIEEDDIDPDEPERR